MTSSSRPSSAFKNVQKDTSVSKKELNIGMMVAIHSERV
jgi:hypothetical protein